jgi:hypothetical protein
LVQAAGYLQKAVSRSLHEQPEEAFWEMRREDSKSNREKSFINCDQLGFSSSREMVTNLSVMLSTSKKNSNSVSNWWIRRLHLATPEKVNPRGWTGPTLRNRTRDSAKHWWEEFSSPAKEEESFFFFFFFSKDGIHCCFIARQLEWNVRMARMTIEEDHFSIELSEVYPFHSLEIVSNTCPPPKSFSQQNISFSNFQKVIDSTWI